MTARFLCSPEAVSAHSSSMVRSVRSLIWRRGIPFVPIGQTALGPACETGPSPFCRNANQIEEWIPDEEIRLSNSYCRVEAIRQELGCRNSTQVGVGHSNACPGESLSGS